MNLKELVGRFVSQSGKQHLMDQQLLFERWPEYVGDICAQFSKCEDLRNGILYVRVQNAALKFELFGHKSQILKRCRRTSARWFGILCLGMVDG